MFGSLNKRMPTRIRENVMAMRGRSILRSSPELCKLLQPDFFFERKSNCEHISAILDWLRIATKANGDGGIPQMIKLRDYATAGYPTFAPSYPETTGYMLCSLVFGLRHKLITLERDELSSIATYLVLAQKPNGAFSAPGAENVKGLAFDTGQVLTGLVAFYRNVEKRPDVKNAIIKSGDWLSGEIEPDGSYTTRSSYYKKRAYYVCATMGLMQASLEFQRDDWRAAAIRNAKWTMAQRVSPVWFRHFSFENSRFQNLHGIAYTIRGLLDIGRTLGIDQCVEAAKSCVDAILKLEPDLTIANALPGYFAENFSKYTTSISPTGMCQIALSCFILAELTGEPQYAERATKMIQVVKSFHFSGFKEDALNGLLPGSWPVTGPYMHCALPNWPIKFFLDGLYICEGAKAIELEG